MKIETGYLYHIKDEYFDIINDKGLMINHEKGHSRPTYFTIKDGNILWFIPISSKVDKYKKIVETKIRKYGNCKSIIIDKIINQEMAILIQNAFPTLEKYVDHVHMENGVPVKVAITLQEKILLNFENLIKKKRHGVNLFFTDIDKIKEKMLEEIDKNVDNI